MIYGWAATACAKKCQLNKAMTAAKRNPRPILGSLLGCVLLATAAAQAQTPAGFPLTGEDVRFERHAINTSASAIKTDAIQVTQSFGITDQTRLANRGCSRVENKLHAWLAQPKAEAPTLTLTPLPTLIKDSARRLQPKKILLTRIAADFDGIVYLGRKDTAHPEIYFSREDSTKDIVVLQPQNTIQLPAGLPNSLINTYLEYRNERNLVIGQYWADLHSGLADDETLLKLRCFDFLDLHAPKNDTLVYLASIYPAADQP